ncbi:MAG: oxidoreductase [Alphaproteobacteria bacterium]|nr:oxidoreductase [Alphaproteobacteria bacterium]
MSDLARLTLDEVHGLAMEIFNAHGLSEDQATAVADTVTAAERDECKSHGLFRVPGYMASVKSGKVTPDAAPKVHDLAPGVAQVDANNGFAPLALKVGREPLASKAREQGIAVLGVVNCYHFAALWPETESLAEQGLVAFACTSYMPCVAPAGGTKQLYGTNPIAFSWPRGEGKPPMVFDQATAASARGEIMIHERDGKSISEGWAIDPDGNPTTDPTAGLAGAQLPFGGYKGAAFAMMVELMAGALIGDMFSYEAGAADNGDGGPSKGGEFMFAIDPARCAGGGAGGDEARAAQIAHSNAFFDKVMEQDGARLPSDRRYEARKRTPTEGITIPHSLYDTLQELRAG